MRANDPEWRDQITTFSLRTNLHQCCKLLITCQLLMMESDPTEISKANLFQLYKWTGFSAKFSDLNILCLIIPTLPTAPFLPLLHIELFPLHSPPHMREHMWSATWWSLVPSTLCQCHGRFPSLWLSVPLWMFQTVSILASSSQADSVSIKLWQLPWETGHAHRL